MIIKLKMLKEKSVTFFFFLDFVIKKKVITYY